MVISLARRVARWLAPVCVALCLGAAPEAKEPVLSSWRIPTLAPSTMRILAERFEIAHRDASGFEIYVPASRTQELLWLAPSARLIDKDMARTLRDRESSDPAFAGYRSLAEVESTLRNLVARYPEIAALEQYGTSEQGRPLYALKLSDHVAADEDEPELMLTAATHGDEIVTTETLLTLVEELVAGYGVDARLTAMVDDHEIHVIPVVNADGFASRSRYAGGVDPNRAYPWPEQPRRNPTACIAAVMAFFGAREIKGSIDFHAYGRLVMYPWAYTYDPIDAADRLAMQNLGDLMAQSNRYTVGPIADVIYVAQGSSADYYYWQKGSLSYGIELTTSKAPPTSTIPRVVDEAREMTWRFIEHF